ncbi:MAG: serine/threonine-protein kinase [Sulfuricaulis sp.]
MEPSNSKTQVLAQPPAAALVASPDIANVLAARYEILDTLGEGGMGLVYRVRDRETSEILALKVLRPEIAREPAMMERFKDEIRLARRITHKNVSRIYDFNRLPSVTYLTMEYVDGESLHAYLKRAGKLPPARVINLAQQITAGLSEAHAQGVVHRDLKPENVMLARDGLVKLMDFGIARALSGNTTATQTVIGTPGYMAPEQSQGKAVDQRTDLYALGLILYECLTGKRAFSGATPVEVALKQLKDRPVPPRKLMPGTPPNLEAIVLRCLEREPGRRFASAVELQRALAKLSAAPQQAPRGRRTVVITIILVLAAVVFQQSVKHAGSMPKPATPSQIVPPVVSPQTSPPEAAPQASEPVASAQAEAAPADLSGRPPVPEELTKLFEAAKQGDATAQRRVGRLFLDGPASDEHKAFYWIRRAAFSGDHAAQFTLGQMYESGRGVERNVVTAYVMYSVAASFDNESARAARDRLRPELSNKQLAAAQRRLRKLRAGREQ